MSCEKKTVIRVTWKVCGCTWLSRKFSIFKFYDKLSCTIYNFFVTFTTRNIYASMIGILMYIYSFLIPEVVPSHKKILDGGF